MFSALIVVLSRDHIAILGFSAGQRQISLSVVSCSESLSAQTGMEAISSDSAEQNSVFVV
jgi:hypothetical protein